MENARARDLPHEHVVIHTIRQDFSVDDHDGVANPEGMVGSQLIAHVHVVHGQRNRIETGVRAVQSLQLSVENVAFNGLASALAVLTISDHILTHEALPADQRETSFGAMVEVALAAAFA